MSDPYLCLFEIRPFQEQGDKIQIMNDVHSATPGFLLIYDNEEEDEDIDTEI